MFNDPIDQQREKAQNSSNLRQMKIEDQLIKADLTDVPIPKGIYENLPTIENTITIEDEDEDEYDEEA
jgi:hypothetical protein